MSKALKGFDQWQAQIFSTQVSLVPLVTNSMYAPLPLMETISLRLGLHRTGFIDHPSNKIAS